MHLLTLATRCQTRAELRGGSLSVSTRSLAASQFILEKFLHVMSDAGSTVDAMPLSKELKSKGRTNHEEKNYREQQQEKVMITIQTMINI